MHLNTGSSSTQPPISIPASTSMNAAMNTFAFTAPSPIVTTASRTASTPVCTTNHYRSVPRAELKGDKRRFSNNLLSEKYTEAVPPMRDFEYRGPQGWTPYAEKVNGRMAQLGFVIGLVTEIASGKPIGDQILVMFSPLVAAANELTVLGAQAAHLGQNLN